MSDMPEQIDDLIYAPDPDYPYPFPVPQPPHFWMTEQTGKLSVAVERYFSGERLSPDDLRLLRSYLHQYVARAMIAEGADRQALLRKIEMLKSNRDVERFADELSEAGIEPF
ncbi:hypothetical protein [Roseiflexus castenholzii]|jgi:hypothetical protein|uniref:Uncharacterized protein n=1 Tax=Roseiflexus castenholzii (strain DSM 13941 / HLO8) TaxID=383372 RepID=A7NJR4_ROSCS|nr:hypothetical protein [Roseiflexus castenholzii]ABU57734.1 conserved hypothetical protein [Roseiflexus castenholzii DSM 13941]